MRVRPDVSRSGNPGARACIRRDVTIRPPQPPSEPRHVHNKNKIGRAVLPPAANLQTPRKYTKLARPDRHIRVHVHISGGAYLSGRHSHPHDQGPAAATCTCTTKTKPAGVMPPAAKPQNTPQTPNEHGRTGKSGCTCIFPAGHTFPAATATLQL